MSPDRILLVPRWSGHRDSDFYPWLARALKESGWQGELDIVALRPPDAPDVRDTVSAIRARLSSPHLPSRTILIGHSVGSQAAIRALAELPARVKVAAFLGVAAWWTIDRPWPEIQPWLDTPLDEPRARTAASRRVILLSTDDPFTADTAATQAHFERRLAAEVRVQERAGHFNREQEPAVLAAVRELASRRP